MGKKSSPPASPDYAPLIQAQTAAASAATSLGQQQLDWAKTQYANDKTLTDKTTSDFLSAMDFNKTNATADRALYDNTFTPEYNSLINDANTYASPEKKAEAMGAAEGTVGQQFDAQRASAEADLESYGINPSATRYGALDIGVRTQEAAAKAAAGTAASANVDQTARDLRTQALTIGQSLPGQSQNESTAAGNDANAAVGNELSTTASGASTMGTMPQYAGIAANDLSGAAATTGQQYSNQLDAYKAEQSSSSGVGDILGLGAGILTKAIGLKKGGAVPVDASPSRGAIPDDVSTKLSAGEYVMPKEAVAWYGEKHLKGLVEKARKDHAIAHPAPAKITPQQARQAIPLR